MKGGNNTKDSKQIQKWLAEADVVIVTVGNGFAQMEGPDIFEDAAFPTKRQAVSKRYHVKTIADVLDKNFDFRDEKQQFQSRLINEYSVEYEPSKATKQLKEFLNGKNYFIATSVLGHFLEITGFEQEETFNTFGDWTRMQCFSGLNHGTHSDLSVIRGYINGQDGIPHREDCDSPMEVHMPLDIHFSPDEDASTRFQWFLTRNQTEKVMVSELGVDPIGPQLFDSMVELIEQFKDQYYATADLSRGELSDNIQKRNAGLGTTLPEVIEKISKNGG